MQLDLRKLFDQHRVTWRDRGPNTSPNNINLACPWCGNDPSFHLSVSEIGEGYYCFRNSKHSGRSLNFLFKKLGIPTVDEGEVKSSERTVKPDKDYSAWKEFTSAVQSDEALNYLKARGFTDPRGACVKFGLMYQAMGRWAGRLIIPLTIGWTGRSLRPHIEPRYLAHTSESGFFYYSNHSSSVILVEGALDAMRLASVSQQFDYIGRCGNRISSALILHLRQKQYFSIYHLPDSDVKPLQYFDDIKQLSVSCTHATVTRLTLPEAVKDPAEMEEYTARAWVNAVTRQHQKQFQEMRRHGNNKEADFS